MSWNAEPYLRFGGHRLCEDYSRRADDTALLPVRRLFMVAQAG